MKKLLSLGLIMWASATNARNAVATQDQGQARQLGILGGGTATQYVICVKKGFLAKNDQSAEETAKSFFEKMRANGGPDQSAYIPEGWDMVKKEISAPESLFTQEKCAGEARSGQKSWRRCARSSGRLRARTTGGGFA